MSGALQGLKSQLSALTVKERAELAQFLLRTLEDAEDEAVEAAWEAELNRRVGEIESGRAPGTRPGKSVPSSDPGRREQALPDCS